MRKIYLTTLLLIGLIVSGNAQQSFWSLNWDITKGMGDTGDYIGDTNFRGISFDGRYFVNDNLTIGGFASWYALTDKVSNKTLDFDNGDGTAGSITGTQVRYLNVFPVLINTHYYIDTGGVTPYFGIGLGTVYSEQRTDFGLSSFYADSWAFGAQPEVGVFVPFGYSGTGLNLALRYLYGSSAGDLDSLSMFSFAIGLGFMN
ncbi:MAG: hypothetical protein J7K34_08255 [Flavobacteriaceae bacterium]|nr:hypothetical protein [Flavobacteriaceae bacterium]